MVVVEVEEAREHLTELLARVAAGESVVIADGGRSVARLVGPPLFPTTPEELEATREQREEFIREVTRWREEAGNPVPDGSPLRAVLDGQPGAAR